MAGVAYWDGGRRLLGWRASLTGTAGVPPALSAERNEVERSANSVTLHSGLGIFRHFPHQWLRDCNFEGNIQREAASAALHFVPLRARGGRGRPRSQ